MTVGPSEQQSAPQDIGPENRVVQKQDEGQTHQTDRTLMVKINRIQTPVASIQGGVPFSKERRIWRIFQLYDENRSTLQRIFKMRFWQWSFARICPRNKYLTKRLKQWIWSCAEWLACFEHQFILQEKFENWSLKCKQHLRQGGWGDRLTQHMPIQHIFAAECKIDGSVNSSLFSYSEYRIVRTRMLYRDRLETIENSQSTNSAKTLKIFNVYSSLGLQKIMSQFFNDHEIQSPGS